MKYALSFIMVLLTLMRGHTQEAAKWSSLLADEKQYVNTVISPEHRAAYLAQIHIAHVVHAKVWAEIKKLYPTMSLNGNWNMIEKFSPGGELSGVLWTEEQGTTYYQFQYGSDRSVLVSQQPLAQLPDTIRNIISHFQNWEHPVFATHGEALGAPRDRPFFLGSRVSGEGRQIVCFY